MKDKSIAPILLYLLSFHALAEVKNNKSIQQTTPLKNKMEESQLLGLTESDIMRYEALKSHCEDYNLKT